MYEVVVSKSSSELFACPDEPGSKAGMVPYGYDPWVVELHPSKSLGPSTQHKAGQSDKALHVPAAPVAFTPR
jgi:hypothetical protein